MWEVLVCHEKQKFNLDSQVLKWHYEKLEIATYLA